MQFYNRFSSAHKQLLAFVFFVAAIGVVVVSNTASAAAVVYDDIFSAVKDDDDSSIRSSVETNPSSLESIGPGGQTPLIHAVLNGKLASVKTLLELGADRSATEKDGYNVLHAAGFQGRVEILRVLLDSNNNDDDDDDASLDPKTDQHPDGFYPLHRACWGRENRHAETVKAFLTNGVPYDLASKDGKTCGEMTRNEATKAVLFEFQQQGYEL